jgi:hypothetical protein
MSDNPMKKKWPPLADLESQRQFENEPESGCPPFGENGLPRIPRDGIEASRDAILHMCDKLRKEQNMIGQCLQMNIELSEFQAAAADEHHAALSRPVRQVEGGQIDSRPRRFLPRDRRRPVKIGLDSPHSRLLMMIQEQLCKECIEKTTVENLVFLRLRLQTRLLRLPTEMARFQKALTRSTDVLDLPPMSCLQTVNISYECGKKL